MDYLSQKANEIAGLKSLDTARRAKQVLPRENYTSDFDPVPSEIRDRTARLEALPEYARGVPHHCPECAANYHTLCPATGKSELILTTRNHLNVIRSMCTACGEMVGVTALSRKCANCDPSLGDWNPNSPQNLAIKAEYERKRAEESEVKRNRELAREIVLERLIDEYLQEKNLKWKVGE